MRAACPVKNGSFASEIAKLRGGRLLELDLGASGLELLLDVLGFGLRSVLLDGLRRAFDEVLGFLEAQACDGADFLDDTDLVRAGFLEDDGELGLRLGGGSGGGGTGGRAGGDSSGSGNAPLAFEVFNECGEVENRLRGQPLDNLVFGDVAQVDFSFGGLAVSRVKHV